MCIRDRARVGRRAAGTSSVPRPGSGPHRAASPTPAPARRRRSGASAARPAAPPARPPTAPVPAAAAAWPGVAWAAAGAGRSSPLLRRTPGRPAASRRPASALRRSARSSADALGLGRAPGLEQLPQKRGDVSLHLDHPARLPELGLGPLQAAAQLDDLPLARIGRLAAATAPERLERARIPLLPPLRQMRAVEALPAQQHADLARPRARLRLSQDPQ